jgi:hypothetical protein
MGTLHAAMDTGDIVAGAPMSRENMEMPEMGEPQPEQPMGGMPQ